MTNQKDENTIDARPKQKGYDPLAGGQRLHNLTNSSDANSYAADHNELVIPLRAPVSFDGKISQPLKQPHKVPNDSRIEQNKVAKGRVEKSFKSKSSR